MTPRQSQVQSLDTEEQHAGHQQHQDPADPPTGTGRGRIETHLDRGRFRVLTELRRVGVHLSGVLLSTRSDFSTRTLKENLTPTSGQAARAAAPPYLSWTRGHGLEGLVCPHFHLLPAGGSLHSNLQDPGETGPSAGRRVPVRPQGGTGGTRKTHPRRLGFASAKIPWVVAFRTLALAPGCRVPGVASVPQLSSPSTRPEFFLLWRGPWSGKAHCSVTLIPFWN